MYLGQSVCSKYSKAVSSSWNGWREMIDMAESPTKIQPAALGCDESEERFQEALRTVGRQKPKGKVSERRKPTGGSR
jgi:hypothetical protein